MGTKIEYNPAAFGAIKMFGQGKPLTSAAEVTDSLKAYKIDISASENALKQLSQEVQQFQKQFGAEIDAKYKQTGGASGPLGKAAPILMKGSFYVFPDGQAGMEVYENGAIVASAETGVHEMHGEIYKKWRSLWTGGFFLGYPTTDQGECPDKVGHYNHFQKGTRLASIYWTPETGAHDIYGDVRGCWEALGWERSFLGYPVIDQSRCPDHTGEYIHFQHNGSIYWSPGSGAHEIHGYIRQKYKAMGWERSLLGYPTTNEGGCPDKVGRFNHFEHGSIYWTPKTGPHEVHGPIRERWKEMGWERSFLGYPISDVEANPDHGSRGKFSRFQGGYISWMGPGYEWEKDGKIYQIHAQEHKNGTPYIFAMEWVDASTMRTGHFGTKDWGKDQDTISMDARVNGKEVASHHRYIGDVSNGQTKSVGDKIQVPVDDPAARVTLSFIVVNHGDGDTPELEKLLKQGFDKLNQWADKEIGAEAGALIGGAIGGVLGSALGAAVGAGLQKAWDFAFPDCDGVVAYDVIQGSAATINDYVGAGNPYIISKHYPGSSSADGCGSNSDYVVRVRIGFQ